jgi:bacteriorhodopsin
MAVLENRNDVLNINPTGDPIHLTTAGSDWLWAVTAFYGFSLIVVVCLMFFAPRGEKIFHYLFTISLFVGSIAYFAMASDLGSVSVIQVDNNPGPREIFYARYINWFVLS